MHLAINAFISGVAATIAPIRGAVAMLFEGEELTFTLQWTSRLFGVDTEYTPVTLTGLDFVFLLAFVFGLYSPHRLVTIHKQGEVEKGAVLPKAHAQVRRAIRSRLERRRHRDLFAFPYARLIDLFNRRRTKRTRVE